MTILELTSLLLSFLGVIVSVFTHYKSAKAKKQEPSSEERKES